MAYSYDRRIAAGPALTEWDFGRFRITAPDKVKQFLEDVLGRVDKSYSKAGFPLGKRIEVKMGSGRSDAAAYFQPQGNYIGIMSKAIRGGILYESLVHELAHWFHFNRLSGGFHNSDVLDKYDEVIESQGGEVAPDVDLGELEKKLKSLKRKRLTLLKKIGKVGRFKVPGHEDRVRRSGGKYVREVWTYGVQPMQGGLPFIKLRIENPSASDLKKKPLPTSGFHEGKYHDLVPVEFLLPGLGSMATKWKRLQAEINEVEEAIVVYRRRHHGTGRYEETLSDWMATEYGKTDVEEWFAELMTVAVLNPAKLSKPAMAWLHSLA